MKRVMLNYRRRRGASHSDVKSTAQLQVRRGILLSDEKSTAQLQAKEGCFTLRCKEYCSTTGEGGAFHTQM